MALVLVAICIVALIAAVLAIGVRDRRAFERRTITRGSLGSAIRCVLFCLLFLPGTKVHADATLLIEAPINFLGHVSSTGHAALLVDDLCSDDHVHLRWCQAGENGAVISRYKGIDGYDWLANAGFDLYSAQQTALTKMYDALNAQAQALSYVDVYWLLAVTAALMFLLCFLLEKNEPGASGDIQVH